MALKTFIWCLGTGATRTTALKTNSVSFGDGYEQVSSFGINNARETWQVTKKAYKDEIDAIHDFIVEHKGVTPFYVTMGGETKAYRTEGDPTVTHLGGHAWQISFNLKQVFIP